MATTIALDSLFIVLNTVYKLTGKISCRQSLENSRNIIARLHSMSSVIKF